MSHAVHRCTCALFGIDACEHPQCIIERKRDSEIIVPLAFKNETAHEPWRTGTSAHG